MDWKAFLSQMTDEELNAIARVHQLEDADILTKEDLILFVEIMEKYNPGPLGVVYEDHDPDVNFFESPGES
jgi:hypothetical protein